jgi:hypothetical protein
MSILSNARINFIRKIFQRDKQRVDLGLSTRELIRNAQSSYAGSAFDVMNTDMRGMFTLDHGMLDRFGDYDQMDQYGEISAALNIYADEATQTDSSKGKALWVESKDELIQKELTDMFEKRVDIDNAIWPMARNLCKYGNEYNELIIGGDGAGVVGIQPLPTPSVRRVESLKGDLLGFLQTFSGNLDYTPEQFEKFRLQKGAGANNSKDVAVFEDWRLVHMRLVSKYRESLYGWSVIDPARWIWKRLMLLEDAVLLYKLSRSPSRFAFYIDTGSLPAREAEQVLNQAKNRLKKKKFVNPNTGKVDLRNSPLSMDEDFFFSVKNGKESVRVDTLSGPAYQQTDDVDYFLKKFYAAIMIPRAYMGYDENMPSRATLCLSGDTRIPLLNGTSPTIRELSESDYGSYPYFWVYSCDSKGNVVPGKGHDARLTQRHVNTVEVVLDNGKVVTCTPEHLFLCQDGTYKEAQNLSSYQALKSKDIVVSVVEVRTGSRIDVYDITVDEYHNFALEQGVFVHNSQEDVRFCRGILRIQREIINGCKKMSRVNLAAKNIDPASVEFVIKMAIPSSIFELGQLAVMRERADLASSMERHVSQHWLLQNIYHLSDAEIEKITGQKQKDLENQPETSYEQATIHSPSSTERMLFSGNREDEKRLEEVVKRVMEDPNSSWGKRLRETGYLLREISSSLQSQ